LRDNTRAATAHAKYDINRSGSCAQDRSNTMARTKQHAMKQQSKQPVKHAESPAIPTGHRNLYSDQAADSTIIWIGGKMVAVDSEIVELVEAVNAIRGYGQPVVARGAEISQVT
jgi:hypothetical protein